MIRLALLLSLASAPAQACVVHSLEDLLNASPFTALTADGSWQTSLQGSVLEGFCTDCADQRAFMLTVTEIEAVDLSVVPAFLERERTAFCTDIAQAGAGQCIETEAAPLGDIPGLTGLAEVNGELLHTDVLVCSTHVLTAQAGGTTPSAELDALATSLRSALEYVVMPQ